MHVLGLDVGKDELHAHLLPCGNSLAVPNTAPGFTKLLKWARQHDAVPSALHVVMEATGVYWEPCAAHFHAAGCTVSVQNPAQIKFFARSLLRRGKTDRMDAATIAQYGVRAQPEAWQPPTPAAVELKLLVRERETLTVTLNQEQNRLHALRHRAQASHTVLALVEQRIALLRAQLADLETAMRAAVEQHPIFCEQLRLLQTIPGYGFVTSVSVIAETDGFARLTTGRQISAYAGIAPTPFESGTSVRGRGQISKVGNAHLRRTAYLAASGAQHSKGKMGAFYRHLRQQGKPPKVALIALGRKLLRVGLAVVKFGEPYREEFTRSISALPSTCPTPQ